MVVVDRAAAMSASAYDNLPAKQKLAQLLDVMKVPTAIPAKLSPLAAFAATNGWQTACAALAEIRHGYVHSNKKRRQVVLSAPNLATFEAWQLSIWDQKLALLYLLNHRGEYVLKPLQPEQVLRAVQEGMRWSAAAVDRAPRSRAPRRLPAGSE